MKNNKKTNEKTELIEIVPVEQNVIETNYQTYIESIKEKINGVMNSYVMIGYYLNKLFNENIFEFGGYKSIIELAKAEFDLSETTIKNTMSVANKYCNEDGSIKEEFKDFKFSALVELLPVPDEKLVDYTPSMTVTEIRDKKKESKTITETKVITETKTTTQIEMDDEDSEDDDETELEDKSSVVVTSPTPSVPTYDELHIGNLSKIDEYKLRSLLRIVLSTGKFYFSYSEQVIGVYFEKEITTNIPYLKIGFVDGKLVVEASDDDIHKHINKLLIGFNEFIEFTTEILSV